MPLSTIAFLASLLIILVGCVCNPRSKRFHKHKSFILSHDLKVPSTAGSTAVVIDANHTTETIDDTNKLKLISLNRALPDIPQPSTSDAVAIVVDHEKVFPNSSTHQFVQIIQTTDRDSIYTVTNNITNVEVNQNHPYARIGNSNLLSASSTENDTDDYLEQSPVATHVVNNPDPYQADVDDPNVPGVSYAVLDSPRIRPNSLDGTNFDHQTSKPKWEVSYNTISVREPLAKVLAERENIEHHYNEVEEERISSFYEEITTGSATYSIIDKTNDTVDGVPPTTAYPIERNPNPIPPSEVSLPIYSLVDKKSKRSSCPVESFPSNILYTKVIKPSQGTMLNKDSKPILQRYSPPPPLPPPLNKDAQKFNRNTISFGVSSSHSDDYDSSAGNIYQKITPDDSSSNPGYETVYREPSRTPEVSTTDYDYEAISNDENDPAYEIVKQENGYETIKNQNSAPSANPDPNDEQIDPNYEIIAPARSYPVSVTVNNTRPESRRSTDDNVTIIEHL